MRDGENGGRPDGLAQLRRTHGLRRISCQIFAFDAIRQDEEIVALVGEWEQAENVC